MEHTYCVLQEYAVLGIEKEKIPYCTQSILWNVTTVLSHHELYEDDLVNSVFCGTFLDTWDIYEFQSYELLPYDD